MNNHQIFVTPSAGIAFTGIATGFTEEMVFRGVILNLLKERWNVKIAVLVPSISFALAHIVGRNFTLTDILQVLVAGTMVGFMFFL